MDRLFFSLLTLALQWFLPRYNAQLQLSQAQIRILRSRIDVSRIVPTPQEKAELFLAPYSAMAALHTKRLNSLNTMYQRLCAGGKGPEAAIRATMRRRLAVKDRQSTALGAHALRLPTVGVPSAVGLHRDTVSSRPCGSLW